MLLVLEIVLVTYVIPILSEVDKRVITSQKYSNYRVKLTVVNGHPAMHTDVPHLVSLKEPIAKNGKMRLWANLCGASVISSNGRLLTAAHCFEGNNFFYTKHPHLLRAVTGSSKTDIQSEGISGISKEGVQWREVIKAILHHNFNFPYYDIALAFVDQPWDYEKGVALIALPKATDFLEPCYTAGYGKIGHGTQDPTSMVLLLAQIEPLSRDMCSMVWDMKMDGFICTNSRTSDVSEGDSGGPLWCEPRHGRVLVGVVSGKNYDKSTLYTRVSVYTDWIRANGATTLLNKGIKTCISFFHMFCFVSLVMFLVD